MSVEKVTRAVVKFFEGVLEKTGRVIEVRPNGDGWTVLIETVEESEYTRKIGRGDMLALYEVNVGKDFEIADYCRKGLKERSA
ncbi:MAG: gas vesicle protein GvpO, partial [Nitrospinota bacterium]